MKAPMGKSGKLPMHCSDAIFAARSSPTSPRLRGEVTGALQVDLLAAEARLFGRTSAGFRQPRGNLRGLRLRSPTRRVPAVAPGARPVKGVDAEFVHFFHLMHPGR